MKLRRTSPPTLDRRTSAAFWVIGVANALATEQLDVPELFRDADLDIAMLGDPDARFATEQVSLLWELAVARSGNPAVGLVGATCAKPGKARVERRLAAILAADIAGYSRLMGADEICTARTLRPGAHS
jgi:hypothetical protein